MESTASAAGRLRITNPVPIYITGRNAVKDKKGYVISVMVKVNFYLPDFYENFHLILLLDDLMKQSPECFFDDIRIGAVYGCFPGSIWNGGRVILGSCTKQEIDYVIAEFNQRGIALRYTFTNPLLEKHHLLDTFCNLCMEAGDNGRNEVLVNSPLLEDFICSMYPGYKILSSTTKCIKDTELLKQELEKDYALVVLDSAMNNTDELFALEHKEKIELIVNHYCQDDCPRRKEHYDAVGRCQLTFSETDFPVCGNINRDFYQIMQNRSFLTTEDIYGRYRESGFVHFKLDGRGFHISKVLESFVYYLVKPEYRDRVRLCILRKIFAYNSDKK